MFRFLISFITAATVLVFSGCGSYVLQGRVVRGDVSSIEIVHATDQRLSQPGLGTAEVRVVRDPRTLNRHVAGQSRSNAAGDFTVMMKAFGTGWMQEQWLVQEYLPGSQNAEAMMSLPSKGGKWRMLITLAPGAAMPLGDDELMRDLERFR